MLAKLSILGLKALTRLMQVLPLNKTAVFQVTWPGRPNRGRPTPCRRPEESYETPQEDAKEFTARFSKHHTNPCKMIGLSTHRKALQNPLPEFQTNQKRKNDRPDLQYLFRKPIGLAFIVV
jgi:hypothetical protein